MSAPNRLFEVSLLAANQLLPFNTLTCPGLHGVPAVVSLLSPVTDWFFRTMFGEFERTFCRSASLVFTACLVCCFRCFGRIQRDDLRIWTDVVREDTHHGGQRSFFLNPFKFWKGRKVKMVPQPSDDCDDEFQNKTTAEHQSKKKKCCMVTMIRFSGELTRSSADGNRSSDFQRHFRSHLFHGWKPGIPH